MRLVFSSRLSGVQGCFRSHSLGVTWPLKSCAWACYMYRFSTYWSSLFPFTSANCLYLQLVSAFWLVTTLPDQQRAVLERELACYSGTKAIYKNFKDLNITITQYYNTGVIFTLYHIMILLWLCFWTVYVWLEKQTMNQNRDAAVFTSPCLLLWDQNYISKTL